jgi:sigma-B regulation protein RsbU (phosphoserine phosphatase)
MAEPEDYAMAGCRNQPCPAYSSNMPMPRLRNPCQARIFMKSFEMPEADLSAHPYPRYLIRLCILVLLFACCFSRRLDAQTSTQVPATFDFDRDREPILSLNGVWRFHPGDDADGKLGWAKPDFDDSSWPLLRSNTGWGEQGYKGYTGFAWYRFKVLLPNEHRPWAISLPRLLTSYQVFADGRLIGQFGGMPPHAEYVVGFDQIFALPADLPSPGHAVTFAIRVWHWPWFPKGVSGGPTSTTRVGEIDALRTQQTYDAWGRFWSSSSGNVLMLMNLLAAFAGLFLFWMRPQDREYLWFGIYELLTGLDHLVLDYYRFHPTPQWIIFWLDSAFSAASWFLFLLFIFTILNGRKNWLFWAAVATPVVTILGQLAFRTGWIDLVQFDLIWALALVSYFCYILGLLYQKATRGVPDAQLMLIPVAFCYLCWLAVILLTALGGSGHTWVYRDLHWFFEVSRRPFPFSVNDLADMVMLIAVVAVLPLRFARSRRDEERLASEVESARTVQQVLIPNEVPPVPGFAIHCVYKPAGQVGGDFFQVIPLESGGALIAVGDVSGKGMPAAMTVSLLVGTLRTLAHYTQRPSEILGSMNRRMLSRSQGGFTTCIVLRIEPQGAVTVANAGHLAPYLAGQEIALENGFPLGITAEADYPEVTFQLPVGAQLTLYTDGVVEARARSGELLGFDRAAALSMQPAEVVAQTAQSFGQDDDITVLTVLLESSALLPETPLGLPLSATARLAQRGIE